MTREPWHRRAGARLPGGPGAGVRRADGAREATRRRVVIPECFRCAAEGWVLERDKNRRKLVAVRVIAASSTLGTALLCGECIGFLAPLDPDPLTVTPSP